MFVRLILVFLVLESISAAEQNAAPNFYTGDDMDNIGLTMGELLTINLRKRNAAKYTADDSMGRGLVYSGPVKVITDANDHSKYYMDKGAAFDSTGQDYGEDYQYQQGALYRQNRRRPQSSIRYSPPPPPPPPPPPISKKGSKPTPKPVYRYVPKTIDYASPEENEDPPEYYEPPQSYDY